MIWLPSAWELSLYQLLVPESKTASHILGICANGFAWIWLPVLLGIPLIRGRFLPWVSRMVWAQAFFTIPYQLTGLLAALIRRPSAGMLSAEYGLLAPVYYLGQTTHTPDPMIAASVSMLVSVWRLQSVPLRIFCMGLILTLMTLRVTAGICWPLDAIVAIPVGILTGILMHAGFRGTEKILQSEGIA